MALLRAPSQFSPAVAGGPVTPSCCGCCCCCCCVGSAVATSIALPMVLHQVTRPESPGLQDPNNPVGGAQTDHGEARRAATGPGRRIAGIALAALTVPLVIVIAALLQGSGMSSLAVVAAVCLGVGSYLLGGARRVTSMATPLLIMLVGALAFFGELFLWVVILFSDDAPPAAKILVEVAIVAIPVITTILLAVAGRRRRSQPGQA